MSNCFRIKKNNYLILVENSELLLVFLLENINWYSYTYVLIMHIELDIEFFFYIENAKLKIR